MTINAKFAKRRLREVGGVFWQFLNSNIFIFIMTSIVLTLLTQRHAALEAQNNRLAAQATERSRLLIELTRRAEDIRTHVDQLTQLAERKSPEPVAINCKPNSSGEISKASVDFHDPAMSRAYSALQATVNGTLPYTPALPTYGNTHLLVLMLQTDENFGDRMSRRDLTWSGVRFGRSETIRTKFAVNRLSSTSICDLVHSAHEVVRYRDARAYGICRADPETGGYFCNMDRSRYVDGGD